MSESVRYYTPFDDDDSTDDISFNMEISGSGSRSHTLPQTDHLPAPRLQFSRPAPIHFDEHRPLRKSLYAATTPEEEAYNRRILTSVPKIPSYSEALVKSSRLNRVRAMSPKYIIEEEPRVPPRLERKPTVPLPSVVASGYFRNSMRSIFDRQPLFDEFITESPEDKSLGYYNFMDVYRLKSDFRGMISDKAKKVELSDPSVEHDIGRKLLPWKDQLQREEPASKRLLRDQSSERYTSYTLPLPRIYVYHRSTQSPHTSI